MCGIVGFKARKDFTDFKRDLLKAVGRLFHRGPDDEGLYFDEASGLGLGHRRLSVIDLSNAGRQPMGNGDGSIQIVYNGEIYNFFKLRRELEELGHSFRTNTDTEVVLKAYEQWGVNCLEKFIGMFAFGLWDARKNTLFLARDRLGIKPLFYCLDDYGLIFASELKAIMAFSRFKKEVDPEALPLFLHYQYIPSPRTIFVKTFKLEPGHFATFDDHSLETKAYWTFPHISRHWSLEISERDTISKLEELLIQAVSDRLISDVPLGALLSGGIDSSLVVALMQEVSSTPINTYSIGFSEEKYNEAPWAAKIARYLGTNHVEFLVTPDDALKTIHLLPEIYDEPFADSSAIPTYLVCSLARSHVTVALSGDGGDEQFAGYVRYWAVVSLLNKVQRFPTVLRKIFADLLKAVPYTWIERAYLPLRDYLPQRFRIANFNDKWTKFLDLIECSTLESLYRMTISIWPQSELPELLGQEISRSKFDDLFEKTAGLTPLAAVMLVDLTTYLPDAMLTKVDRASMGVSLEVRVPLLDHRVVEFTSQLPDSLKYRNGTGKYILKKLLAKYLPPKMFERPKMGFGIPIGQWFQKELKEPLTDYLSLESIKKEGLFDPELIEQTIEEHLTGKVNHQYRLWAILMWEMWREKWL